MKRFFATKAAFRAVLLPLAYRSIANRLRFELRSSSAALFSAEPVAVW